MKLRKVAATISVSALALIGLDTAAGASGSTFHVSDTSITAGGTVTVSLSTPCLDGEGGEQFGNLISSTGENQETYGSSFIKGDHGVFHFDSPGTYTITRFCDGGDNCGDVTITVSAPVTTTTQATTTTTTTVPGTTTTTVAGQEPATTAPTTTVAVKVESKTTTAVAAIPVKSTSVRYTG